MINTQTGEIIDDATLAATPYEERRKFIFIRRELTEEEKNNRKIDTDAPCGCGHKKAFSACCFKKDPLKLHPK